MEFSMTTKALLLMALLSSGGDPVVELPSPVWNWSCASMWPRPSSTRACFCISRFVAWNLVSVWCTQCCVDTLERSLGLLWSCALRLKSQEWFCGDGFTSKVLSWEHRDLNLAPNTHEKSWVWLYRSVTQCQGGRARWVHWSASLGELLSFGVNVTLSQKK